MDALTIRPATTADVPALSDLIRRTVRLSNAGDYAAPVVELIAGNATPDKVATTPYGVEVAKSVLHYYNNYFGIPFPLKKLDLIGLPDFEAGAMENFGAITYREEDLLLDPKTASIASRQLVASVIAHEMAHQWFGDMVTMQWWDNLWLNEGFATWMENKAANDWHPEWHFERDVADDAVALHLVQKIVEPIGARFRQEVCGSDQLFGERAILWVRQQPFEIIPALTA